MTTGKSSRPKERTAMKPSNLKAVSRDLPTEEGGGRRCLLAKDGKGHGEALRRIQGFRMA